MVRPRCWWPIRPRSSKPWRRSPDPAQAQQSVVFNEMEGVVPGAEEQLVSRDQADVNEVTRVVTPDVNEEGLPTARSAP